MMEQKNQGQQNNTEHTDKTDKMDRREERRRRRRRNQIAAYVTVTVLIAVMAVGIVFGVKTLTENSRQQAQENQEKIEQMLASESEPEPPSSEESTPEPVVVELTPEQKLDEIVNAGIEVMPIEDKVAGLFLVTPEAITGVSAAVQAGEGTQKALAQYAVGGIIYFQKNMQSEEQLSTMIDSTQLYTKYPLFIAVDEEGGTVSRVAEAGIASRVDSAQQIGASGDSSNALQAGSTIGSYLAALGFNLNFAPVADLTNVANSVMEGRSYGSDAASVSAYVTAAMQGLESQNVTACLKHFPGIGSTTEDTHDGIAAIDRTIDQLRAEEFTVFQAAIDAGANMVMVGHVAAPQLLGDNTPCSLSEYVVTDLLRNELGFGGVIISDALNMSAISEYHASDEAAIMALRAGCDMILMPEDFELAYQGVLQAVQDGTISEERINDSLRRIYRIKYADRVTE